MLDRVGLRPLVGEEQIADVLDVLAANEIVVDELQLEPTDTADILKKIQSGNLADVAQVLRDFHLTRQDKQLSYGERRVYDMAQDLLVQELSVAQSPMKRRFAEKSNRSSAETLNQSETMTILTLARLRHLILSRVFLTCRNMRGIMAPAVSSLFIAVGIAFGCGPITASTKNS